MPRETACTTHTTLLPPWVSSLCGPCETSAHTWPRAHTLLLSSCPVWNRCGIDPLSMLSFWNARVVNYKVMPSLFIFCSLCISVHVAVVRTEVKRLDGGGMWDPFLQMMTWEDFLSSYISYSLLLFCSDRHCHGVCSDMPDCKDACQLCLITDRGYSRTG